MLTVQYVDTIKEVIACHFDKFNDIFMCMFKKTFNVLFVVLRVKLYERHMCLLLLKIFFDLYILIWVSE